MSGTDRELRHLARLYGVQCDFVDGTGAQQRASGATLIAVLRALGVDLPAAGQAGEALAWRQEQLRGRGLAPILVGDAGGPIGVELGAVRGAGGYRLRLRGEAGDERALEGRLDELAVHRRGPSLTFECPPPGAYQVVLDLGAQQHRALLLSRPPARPPGSRRWGVFLPMQQLGVAGTDTVGTLDRASAAADWLASCGGSFLGMLPGLAGSRGEPSPYSPLSRCFWNELYLAANWLPPGCPRPEPVTIDAEDLEGAGELLPAGQALNPRRGWEAADTLLDGVIRWLSLSDDAAPARDRLQRFTAQHPRARAYAAYRALAADHGEAWRQWPAALGDTATALAAADAASTRRHLVAQWLAAEQWDRLARSARDRGVDLYLDLPVGVPAASFDAWWWREELASGCTIGAPPDRFFPQGQDWGLAPPHPERQRQAGYAQLRAALAHHLRVAQLLRVDHVMGLHRLYWVPAGASPHEGTYVRYPAPELHAVHAIEAWRRGATLVGEDLGTVPPGVREHMRQLGMNRMWIAVAELGTEGASPLPIPAADSLASLSTHDMPTFAGYWTDADIHRRAELGRTPWHAVEGEKAAREPAKQALIRFLEARGLLAGYSGAEIAAACLRWIAESPAELMAVSLEDLWGETTSINLPGAPPPGTVAPANWLRGSPGALERARDDDRVLVVLRDIDARRRRHDDTGPAGSPC